MKRQILAALIFTALGAATAAIASPAAAPSSAAAAPDPGYAARLALADRIVAAKGGEKEMEGLIVSMTVKPMNAVAATLPEKERPLFAKVEARQQAMMISLLPQMIQISEQAYAAVFNEQELKDILAFTESPTGQAARRKAPEISAYMSQRLIPLIVKQMPHMMDTVVKEVCDEQHCSAQERQTIATLMRQHLTANVPAS